jgi:hypothetical protein
MWAKASLLSKSLIGDPASGASLARCAWSANPQSQASDAHFSFRSETRRPAGNGTVPSGEQLRTQADLP